MMLKLILFGLALTSSASAFAQQLPVRDADTRIRHIDYVLDQVFTVEATPGYQLTINLAPDERIETVAIGNAAAFQVTAARGGNILFIKTSQTDITTNMTVVTDVRRYTLTLVAANGPSPYAVEFQYPKPAPMVTAPTRLIGRYKLSGSKSLWPTRIDDDGEHVFIDWPANMDLPAIYALDGQGRESLTNGMMRGDHMVIDAIAPRLVFKLDHSTATASRRVSDVSR